MITAPLLALSFFTRPRTHAERCAALGSANPADGPILGDVCRFLWDDAQPYMRPTQPGIGWSYAMRKLKKDMDADLSLADSQ